MTIYKKSNLDEILKSALLIGDEQVYVYGGLWSCLETLDAYWLRTKSGSSVRKHV